MMNEYERMNKREKDSFQIHFLYQIKQEAYSPLGQAKLSFFSLLAWPLCNTRARSSSCTLQNKLLHKRFPIYIHIHLIILYTITTWHTYSNRVNEYFFLLN